MGLRKDMATFQTLQTWIGYNATRYHKFYALPHALPNIFSQFNMVWGPFATGCYVLPLFFLKNVYIYIYIYIYIFKTFDYNA